VKRWIGFPIRLVLGVIGLPYYYFVLILLEIGFVLFSPSTTFSWNEFKEPYRSTKNWVIQ
jgi:hypothetical protein